MKALTKTDESRSHSLSDVAKYFTNGLGGEGDLRPPLIRTAQSCGIYKVDVIEDIIQDLFLKIIKKVKDEEKYVCSIRGYIIISFRNKCIDYIRADSTRTRNLFEGIAWLIYYRTGTVDDVNAQYPEEILEKQRVMKILEGKIKELPATQREVMELTYRECLSIDDIAKHLKISYHTAAVRLWRAHNNLKDHMKKYVAL
jgi:RNA polymerase sigma factor (sigma-70 family)